MKKKISELKNISQNKEIEQKKRAHISHKRQHRTKRESVNNESVYNK